ncbi:hypothetical protein HT105_20950, partial [Bacteroides fragilis]|nr:hypothetical protein [Bacteroides fragilis]
MSVQLKGNQHCDQNGDANNHEGEDEPALIVLLCRGGIRCGLLREPVDTGQVFIGDGLETGGLKSGRQQSLRYGCSPPVGVPGLSWAMSVQLKGNQHCDQNGDANNHEGEDEPALI